MTELEYIQEKPPMIIVDSHGTRLPESEFWEYKWEYVDNKPSNNGDGQPIKNIRAPIPQALQLLILKGSYEVDHQEGLDLRRDYDQGEWSIK